ncbi:MAG: hypothetical protein Q4A54_13430, partial [Parabacteroides sp.]|nr:hypothetical protein [Parabacteroides sp.]
HHISKRPTSYPNGKYIFIKLLYNSIYPQYTLEQQNSQSKNMYHLSHLLEVCLMKFSKWIKSHKKQILFYGTLTLIVIGGVIFAYNSDERTWEFPEIPTGEDSEQKILNSTKPIIPVATTHAISDEPSKVIDIEPYLRNLPNGYHPSAEKISTAIEHGFNLNENQTWVDKHTRTYSA